MFGLIVCFPIVGNIFGLTCGLGSLMLLVGLHDTLYERVTHDIFLPEFYTAYPGHLVEDPEGLYET